MPTIILASTSPYRRALLERLRLAFEVRRPAASEDAVAGELPQDRALRLALAKARAVAAEHPDAVVIGGDQVAAAGNHILDKPGNAKRCAEQLTLLSGTTARFHTACAILSGEDHRVHLDTTGVSFRELSEGEIRRYVEVERPFDCAGGFKAEGLGISLFESIDCCDPTALIGLPLIWVASSLRSLGFRLP